jgi:putative addiction module CopG family antidote
MTVTLPTEVHAYLQQRVAEGGFASAEEALIAAVRLLRDQEARDKKARDELRALLEEGVRDADEGRLHVLDAGTIEDMIERAKERHRLREESDR